MLFASVEKEKLYHSINNSLVPSDRAYYNSPFPILSITHFPKGFRNPQQRKKQGGDKNCVSDIIVTNFKLFSYLSQQLGQQEGVFVFLPSLLP